MSTRHVAATVFTALVLVCACATITIADSEGGRWSLGAVSPAATTTPTVTIATPSATGWIVGSPSFTFSGTAAPPATGTLTDVRYRLNSTTAAWTDAANDSGDWTQWHIDATLKTGLNTVYVQAVAGTATSATVSRTITYSPPQPAPVITSPTNGSSITVLSASVTIKGTAATSTGGSALSSVWVSIDGGAAVKATGTSSWSYVYAVTPGTHTVQAESVIHSAAPTDITSLWSATTTFTYAPPPVAVIDVPSVSGGIVDTAAYDFQGHTIPGASTPIGVPVVTKVQYRLNSTTAAWTDAGVSGDNNAWNVPLTLKAGTNTFYVHAVAGTVIGATVSTTITYSPDAPVPVITSPTQGQVITGVTQWTVKGTAAKSATGQAISRVDVAWNWSGSQPADSDWHKATGTSNWSIAMTPLATGTNEVMARSVVTSTLGDLIQYSTVVIFSSAPPVTITITSPAPGPVTGGVIPVTAHLSHTLGVTSVVFKVSGTQFASIPMTPPGSSAPVDVTAYLDTFGTSPALSGNKTLQASTTGNVATSPNVAITITTSPQSSLVGTWQVQSATVNGVPDAVNDALGNPAGTTASTLTFGSDGNWLGTNWGAGSAVVDQQCGTWSPSGNTVTWRETQPSAQPQPTMTYSVSGNQATLTFTPASGEPYAGDTVVLTVSKVTPGANLDPKLVGIWQLVSITASGLPVPLATALQWGPGVTGCTCMFAADGGALYVEHPVTVGQEYMGTWTATGGTLTANYPLNGTTLGSGSYTVSGSTLTVTAHQDSVGTVVAKFTRTG